MVLEEKCKSPIVPLASGAKGSWQRKFDTRPLQGNSTSTDIVKAVRTVTLITRDDVIAGALDRNGLRIIAIAGPEKRAIALRSSYRIPVYREASDGVEPWLDLGEAATSDALRTCCGIVV
jgi:hypothetical protein